MAVQLPSTAQVIASNDVVLIFQNRSYDIPVLENDFGFESGVKQLEVITSPAHGECTKLSSTQIRYTPEYNFTGSDQFEYRVCANNGTCGTATVTIRVNDYDYIPKLTNDTITVIKGSEVLAFNILDNDTDLDDLPIEVSLLTQTGNGTVMLNDDYTISANFKLYFHGIDSLDYRICDAEGDCATARIYFSIESKYDDKKMFVPTAISPDGDGLNDIFFIPDLRKYSRLSIDVFTQWGQTVYNNPDYGNNWNGMANTGSMKGQLLPKGVYYYIIQIEDTDLIIKGNIYLSR
ncbi:MAG: gliding motility-associated C-terminal domain-containing protein [Marinilabiliaceae bacterium]|nr:gliding motility-associated C-terminal domain-containing protein [Marinilabiliaceae bacterium]